MTLRLFPLSTVAVTPEAIEQSKNTTLYAEDTFVLTSTLVPANNAGGSATSTVATLPTSVPLLGITNCLQFFLSSTTANTFAARTGNIGRSFMPGQWEATFFMRFIIGAVSPLPVPMNNSIFMAGFASTSTLPSPVTVDNASILFIHDSLGVGIRLCNGTAISTYRPASPLILTTNTLHTMRLQVYRSTPRADLYVNRVLVMSAQNVNFPAYNSVNRSMFPFIQHARVVADAVNPAPAVYVDDVAMLLTR